MLTEHFQLVTQPFGVTPDARFLYLGRNHREALASLLYGIRSGRGFSALIAPPGMGKTTLIFEVLRLLKGNAKTAFLFQTQCGTEDFLHFLLADLGIDHEGDDATRMQGKLNAYLVEASRKGQEVVVVIDEAQNLDDRVLELVRMLSNFETPGKKLMHLVLSGQPQLADKLASEQFIQLRQRISIIGRLSPLGADETREYIEHRLQVAGAPSGRQVFSSQAYALIAEHSGGIPRNINNLCFNSMSLACAMKKPQVDAEMVRETIRDLDLTTIARPNISEIQTRSWSTLFNPKSFAAGSLQDGRAVWIASLMVLAVLFQLSMSRSDRVLARAAAMAEQQKTVANSTANRKTTATSSTNIDCNARADKDGKRRPSQPDSRSAQDFAAEESSCNTQAPEKHGKLSQGSDAPFELPLQKGKP
jgi:type II secretory pathway predicted ATPase ExeA